MPSSSIYSTISNITKNLDKAHYLKPKYIYILLKNNRYGLWNKILEYHNVDIQSSIISDTSLNNTKMSDNIISFNINFSYETYLKISPQETFYKDGNLGERRYNVLLRKVWTDVLYKKIYDEIKLPCALVFKNCKISSTGFFLTVHGTCNECNCIFKGCIVNKPIHQKDVLMECSLENFDDSIKHKKKRQLKGQRRIEIARNMIDSNTLPSLWRRKEADKIMEFGDPEPPYLPKTNVLRKAKEHEKNKDLGISLIDPI